MKIGLVLGGGFARGAAQAGFLKGLLNYLKPEEIALMSCSSIGAMNGLALSNDNLDYLEYMYRNSNFQNTSNLKLNLKNKLVDQVLDELTNNHNEIRVPLYVTGTCLNSLSTHYFYIDNKTPQEDLYKAVNITVTFPFVNGLYRKEYKRLYLDGGATDNIPVFPFFSCHVDLLIILHCYPRYLPPLKLINSDTVVLDVDIAARCDNGISTYSFQTENLNKMFDVGVLYGKEFGQKVLIDRDLNNIKKRGQAFMRAELPIRKMRKVPLSAAVFFNKLQQSRGFE